MFKDWKENLKHKSDWKEIRSLQENGNKLATVFTDFFSSPFQMVSSLARNAHWVSIFLLIYLAGLIALVPELKEILVQLLLKI